MCVVNHKLDPNTVRYRMKNVQSMLCRFVCQQLGSRKRDFSTCNRFVIHDDQRDHRWIVVQSMFHRFYALLYSFTLYTGCRCIFHHTPVTVVWWRAPLASLLTICCDGGPAIQSSFSEVNLSYAMWGLPLRQGSYVATCKNYVLCKHHTG